MSKASKRQKKKNGRIEYKSWEQKPVYERASNLETSSFTQYRIKPEIVEEEAYADRHVRFFPIKIYHHTHRKGQGVDTVVTGVLDNDTTACVRLRNYHPHIFIAIPPPWLELGRQRGIETNDIAFAMFQAFRTALLRHVETNPCLFQKFHKHDGNLLINLFDPEGIETTGGRAYKETRPWMVGKDCFGFNCAETQTLLRLDFTDNALCRVATDMCTNITGVDATQCAACNAAFSPGEPMLGHHGSCNARYHHQCLEEWFNAERKRGSYNPGKRVYIDQLQDDRDAMDVGDEEFSAMNELIDAMVDDVEVWVPEEESGDADTVASSVPLDTQSDDLTQSVLDSYMNDGDDSCDEDDYEATTATSAGQAPLAAEKGVMKRVADCDVSELSRASVPGEWYNENEETALGSCMCCRSSIYKVVNMSSKALKARDETDALQDEAWKTRRVNFADWWHGDLYPALCAIGMQDATAPEPVDLFGEEELHVARNTNTMLPKPRLTVYDGAVDQRYQLMTEARLHPAVWWKLDRRSVEWVDPDSTKRVSICPVELTVDYRDVSNLEDVVERSAKLPVPAADAPEDQRVLQKRPAVVEMCFDLETRPKTARYKDKDGVYHDSLVGTGFPTPDDDPILNAGVVLHNHADNTQRFYVFALKRVSRTASGMEDFCKRVTLFEFSNERTMLQALVQFVMVIRPMVISHYNGNSFDLPYLVRRCLKLGVRNGEYFGGMIRGRGCYWKTTLNRGRVETSFTLPGPLVLDYLYYAQKNVPGERSYTLNAIAESKLKERKLDMPYALIPEYQQTAEKRAVLAQYVMKDAHLTLRLGLKLSALQRLYGFAKLSHATPEMLMVRKTQYLIGAFFHDSFYKYGCEKYNMPMVLPTLVRKDKPTGREKGYEGAIVFPPERGMYRAVYPQQYGRLNQQVPKEALNNLIYRTPETEHDVNQWVEQMAPVICSNEPPASDADTVVSRFTIAPDRRTNGEAPINTDSNVYGLPGITATLDYASLYPAVMESQNLCLSTYLTKARMARYNMAIYKRPFIHPNDIIYGSNRSYEITVDRHGVESSWETNDTLLQKKLQEAVEKGELLDHETNVTRPDLRSLYYNTVGVWSRPKYRFDNEHNKIYLSADPNTPMFVTDRIRRGIVPEIQISLRKYRQTIRARAKQYAKEIKKIKAGFAALTTDAERIATQERIAVLEFEIEQINALQLAVKLIMNSIYGFFGAPESILPCKPLAETITLTGQYFVMSAAMVSRSEGSEEKGYQGTFRVVYGDTDSVFIHMRMRDPFANTKVYMMNVSKHMCVLVNRRYPWAKIMSLTFEKIFLWILLIAPKNYIGLKLEENGTLSVVLKGVRQKRRDSFVLQGHVIDKVLELIQMGKGLDVIDYVGQMLEDIYEYRIPLQMLAQSTSFSKALDDPTLRENAATVVARKRFERNGQITEPGDRFLIVYRKPTVKAVKSGKSQRWTNQKVVDGIHRAEDLAHALDDPTFCYDAEHYAAAVVQSSLAVLLALVPQPDDKFDELRSLDWLMRRWEERPYFKAYQRRKRAETSLIDGHNALTARWGRRTQCVLCKNAMTNNLGANYVCPKTQQDDVCEYLERQWKTYAVKNNAASRNETVVGQTKRSAREQTALLKRELIPKPVESSTGLDADDDDNDAMIVEEESNSSVWDSELSNFMSLWESSNADFDVSASMQSITDSLDCSNTAAESIGSIIQDMNIDLGCYEFEPATVDMDQDSGVVVISHCMTRQHDAVTASPYADRVQQNPDDLPLTASDAYAAYNYRTRKQRPKTAFDAHWTVPFSNPVPCICATCVRKATLDDPQTPTLWKRAFNATEFHEQYYDTCVRDAIVLRVSPNKRGDRWLVMFVLDKFGVRRQRAPAIVATVRAGNSLHTNVESDLHKAVAENVGNWTICSMCASVNQRADDVASCATIECSNNGMRSFTKKSVLRYRRERASLAW